LYGNVLKLISIFVYDSTFKVIIKTQHFPYSLLVLAIGRESSQVGQTVKGV